MCATLVPMISPWLPCRPVRYIPYQVSFVKLSDKQKHSEINLQGRSVVAKMLSAVLTVLSSWEWYWGLKAVNCILVICPALLVFIPMDHAAVSAKKYIMQMVAVQQDILPQMMMMQRYKAAMTLLELVATHLRRMTNPKLPITLQNLPALPFSPLLRMIPSWWLCLQHPLLQLALHFVIPVWRFDNVYLELCSYISLILLPSLSLFLFYNFYLLWLLVTPSFYIVINTLHTTEQKS